MSNRPDSVTVQFNNERAITWRVPDGTPRIPHGMRVIASPSSAPFYVGTNFPQNDWQTLAEWLGDADV